MEDQVRDFLSATLPEHAEALGGDLHPALKSGVILCDLANHCVPGAVPTVHVQQQAFKQKENVDNFIRAGRSKLALPDNVIFAQADLFEGKNMEKVYQCVVEMEGKLANGEYALAGTGPKRGANVASPRMAGSGGEPSSPKGAFVGKNVGANSSVGSSDGPRGVVSPRAGGGGPPITGNIKKEALARQLRYWLANVLPQYADELRDTEKSFGEVLKSGVIICELVNYLRPDTIKAIHLADLPFKQRENIGNFLTAITNQLKILEVTQFTTPCLFEGKNLGKVVDCLVEVQKNYDQEAYRTALAEAVSNPTDVDSLSPAAVKITKAVEKPRAGNTLVSKNSFAEALKIEMRSWMARELPQHEEVLLDQSQTFGAVLKSGVILCELMIHLIPDCIDSKVIHHGSLVFKQRDNISAFIEVCELTLQFDSNLVFVTADLFEEKNLAKVAATIAEVQKVFRPAEWKISNQVATQKGIEQADAEVEVTNAVDEEEEERERKAEQFRLEREAALQKARQEKAEIEAAERQRRMENSERQKREREERIRAQQEAEERALEEEREAERKRQARLEQQRRDEQERERREMMANSSPRDQLAQSGKRLPTLPPKVSTSRGGDPPNMRPSITVEDDDAPMKVAAGRRGSPAPQRGGLSPEKNNDNGDGDRPASGLVDDLRAQLARLDAEEREEREERERRNRELEEEYERMYQPRLSRATNKDTVVEAEPQAESPREVTKRPSQTWSKTTANVSQSPKPLPQIKNGTNRESQAILNNIKNHDQNKLSLFPVTFLGNTNITSMVMTTSDSVQEIIDKSCNAKGWNPSDYEAFDQEGVPIEDLGLTPSQLNITGVLLRNKKGLEHTATLTIEITEESLKQFEKDNARKGKSKTSLFGRKGKK